MSESEPTQLFDLVVVGHSSDQPVEALVREILDLLGDHSSYLEFKLSDALLFDSGLVSIRDNIGFEEANAIRQKLGALNVECDIRPALQIVPKESEAEKEAQGVYTCPACGHKQKKQRTQKGQLETCEVCGIVGERYLQKQRLQEVMESERQQHENDRSKRIREVLERAKIEEEAMLREEARRRLGLENKDKDKLVIKVAAVVATLAISFGSIYYLNTSGSEEATAVAEGEAEDTEAGAAGDSGAPAAASAEGTSPAVVIQGGNVSPQAIAAVMKNADASLSGGSGGGGGSSATQDASLPAPASPQQVQQQRQAEQQRITTALRDDVEQAEQQDPKERKVLETASSEALNTIEYEQLTRPRFKMLLAEHDENRRRIRQYLRLEEMGLIDMLIEQVEEPYPRTLLLLDMAEWQLGQEKFAEADQTIARINREHQQTEDISQQALILGVISKTHLLYNEWEAAGRSLQQAMEGAKSLPEFTRQIELLSRLANEQTLFGNQIAARQILEEAGKIIRAAPANSQPDTDNFVQLATSYAMLTDFDQADDLLGSIDNPDKRQQVAEFIDTLKYRVEQVRAEYKPLMIHSK